MLAYFVDLEYVKAKMDKREYNKVIEPSKLYLVLQQQDTTINKINIINEVKIANSWGKISQERIEKLKKLFIKNPYFEIVENKRIKDWKEKLNLKSRLNHAEQLTIFDIGKEEKKESRKKNTSKASYVSLKYIDAELDDEYLTVKKSKLILALIDENGECRRIDVIRYFRYCNEAKRVSKRMIHLARERLSNLDFVEITPENFIVNLKEVLTIDENSQKGKTIKYVL